MLDLLTNFVVKVLGRAIPMAIRWYYTPKRMDECIRFRVVPEGDGVQLWAGDLPHAETWVVVTNLSPFPIELDRATLKITFGAPVVEMMSQRRAVIQPSSEETWIFRGPLNVFQADYVRKNRSRVDKITVDFNALFLSRVSNFPVQRSVTTAHFKLFNFELPLCTWLDLSGNKDQ